MFKNHKIALGIEYNGSHYSGWQRQKEIISVQSFVENALAKVADHPVTVFCAGRTDAGVHATGQVVHFVTNSIRPEHAWTIGVNSNLPRDIAIRWIKLVPEEFHARFSAISRSYSYIIFNHCYRSAILSGSISHYHFPLDEQKMERAAKYLIGEHDFTSFRSCRCQSKTPFRRIQQINVNRHGDYIVIEIKANAFLYKMVRNIVGSLIEIGCGNQNEDWLKHLLELKDRSKSAAIAKSEGLYLTSVDYPSYFSLPNTSLGSYFFKRFFGY